MTASTNAITAAASVRHDLDAPPPMEHAERVRLDKEYAAIASREEAPAPRRVAMLVEDIAALDTPPIRSYSTGNLPLDRLLGGGVNTRELAVVLGPPGGCKTAFAVSLSIEVSRLIPVLYVSSELERHELMARVASNRLNRPWREIRRGLVSKDAIHGSARGLPIYLIGSEDLPRDGEQALALIERELAVVARSSAEPPLLVVDYLQDLARGGSDREARTRVGDMVTELRRVSQRQDCPIVAIAAVARLYYSARRAQEFREADDPTVYLAAAKESGDVDYAAARVLFLDTEDDRKKSERAVRIAVAKSRDAETGFAGARVVASTGRFIQAPEAVRELSSPGRAQATTSSKMDDADKAVLETVTRLWQKGDGPLCTKSYLRTGSGVGAARADAAIERLAHLKKLELVPVERTEGEKTKRRSVYRPVGYKVPAEPPPPPQLDMEGLTTSDPDRDRESGSDGIRLAHADLIPSRYVVADGSDQVRTEENENPDREGEAAPDAESESGSEPEAEPGPELDAWGNS